MTAASILALVESIERHGVETPSTLVERLDALDAPSDAVEPSETVDRLPEPEQPQPRAPAHTGREIQTPAAADQPSITVAFLARF